MREIDALHVQFHGSGRGVIDTEFLRGGGECEREDGFGREMPTRESKRWGIVGHILYTGEAHGSLPPLARETQRDRLFAFMRDLEETRSRPCGVIEIDAQTLCVFDADINGLSSCAFPRLFSLPEENRENSHREEREYEREEVRGFRSPFRHGGILTLPAIDLNVFSCFHRTFARYTPGMELDPHTLQQIIRRIEQQMRCPQCGKRVPVDFSSVRMAGDDFMLLQLKCETCEAFIVLHASLQGAEHLGITSKDEATVNASSALNLKEQEVQMLREALGQSNGSFEHLFQQYGETQSSPDIRIV